VAAGAGGRVGAVRAQSARLRGEQMAQQAALGGAHKAERMRLAGREQAELAELSGRQADQRARQRRQSAAQLSRTIVNRIDQRMGRVTVGSNARPGRQPMPPARGRGSSPRAGR
jgi:hypothetical protein